jgi:predicted DNA binding CopG/RHH family protein
MKSINLTNEEKKIEKYFSDLRPTSKIIKNKIEKIFDESRKSRPISLRINEKDLSILKEKADKNGLPYQTMINVIIHKYVNDNYLDKDEIDKYLRLKKAV